MKNSMKTMMLTAAVSGLLGGTAVRLQAAQTPTSQGTATVSANHVNTGKVSFTKTGFDDKDKHSCKGKNDCKGQGGCKASDNGCKGKNDCKGKGGCATDGSKPPQLAA
jgi:hypothetical protein